MMPQVSDPFELLLTHNHWANKEMLEACRALSAEQFHRKFEMGPGSLHDTLLHMFEAVGMWCDRMTGRAPRGFTKDARTIDELLALNEKNNAEFNTIIRSVPLSTAFQTTRMGKTFTFTHGVVVTHVMTHGMHHRAQCLNMLRHVGVKLPPSSVVEWARENDQPK